jgi:hypothetical protein
MSFLLIAVQTVISHQYALHLDDSQAERRDLCSSIVNHTNRKPSNISLNRSSLRGCSNRLSITLSQVTIQDTVHLAGNRSDMLKVRHVA